MRLKTLGMIGGTSWHSTVVYYRLLNEMVAERIGAENNPPLLLYSLNVALMREGDQEKIKSTYLEIGKKLQGAGAEAIIICANTPHQVYPYVAPKLNIPILHIADATGQEAKKQGIKTLGLLGTKPTMTGNFIPARIKEQFDIDTIVPDPEFLDRIHYYISAELTQGKFTEEAKKFYIQQMGHLQTKGAEGIILGCTELPMLLEQDDFELPLMDTTYLHARMATDFILGAED